MLEAAVPVNPPELQSAVEVRRARVGRGVQAWSLPI